MRLEDYCNEDRIVLSAAGDEAGRITKDQALERLTRRLAETTRLEPGVLLDAVRRREGLMSTGIGHGLAVPHVRLEGLTGAAMAVGVWPEGVSDYVSLDEEPVRIVVLIAAPQGQHELYIRLLAQTVDVLKRAACREAILAASSPAEVFAVLTGGGK